MTPLLELDGVSRVYRTRRGLLGRASAVRAVDHVSLQVAPGHTLGIVGESGCGKSTTGRLALGLERPDDGTVRFRGAAMPPPGTPDWRAQRAHMQLVYQDPLGAMDRRLTVAAQVEEPLAIHRIGTPGERKDRVAALLRDVGLRPDQAARHPHALSGGQRQRAVLARALATDPALLVCDEPVSALDVSIQAQIVNMLTDIQAARGIAMLFISHDLKVVRQVSHEVAVMYLGRIVEQGDPDAILRRPGASLCAGAGFGHSGAGAAPPAAHRADRRPAQPGRPPGRLRLPPALRPGGGGLPRRGARTHDPIRRQAGRLPPRRRTRESGRVMRISRRAALGAALLPRFAIAQSDTRPAISVAVQKIANSGVLDLLREQSSNASERWGASILETPIARNQQGRLEGIPGLATAWRRIDAATVELDLREGVRLHNGDTLTADDVVFSFGPERMFGPDLPKDIPAVARRHFPALDRVEAVGKNKVRFVNRTPDLTLEGRISAGGSEIVSERAWRAAGSWQANRNLPVGTGPYRLVDFRPDSVLTLAAHDEYWGGRPPLRSLRFLEIPETASRIAALQSGEVQFATDIPPDQIAGIEKTPGLDVQGGLVLNHRILAFDKNSPPLSDPRVRLAMAHAIDGQAIVDALWAGRTRVPAGLQWEFYGNMFVAGWSVPGFDPARAQALLKEAGYRGEPIVYRARNDYYTAEIATAQILVEFWRAVGLNVKLEVKENWAQVLDKAGPRGLRDWSNSAVFDDPVSSIVNQHGPNGAQQTNGEWTNAEMNRLAPELESSTDPARRKAIFARMLQICEREDPAYIVLHQNAAFTARHKRLPWRAPPSFFLDFSPRNWG